MIRVELPYHLRRLAHLEATEVTLEVPPPVTQRTVLDALEARFPMLRGTIRDHVTQERRPFLRFCSSVPYPGRKNCVSPAGPSKASSCPTAGQFRRPGRRWR